MKIKFVLKLSEEELETLRNEHIKECRKENINVCHFKDFVEWLKNSKISKFRELEKLNSVEICFCLEVKYFDGTIINFFE